MSEAPRRILLVMNEFGWAGAETQLYHLAIGLSESGNDVEIFAIGGTEIDLGALSEAGVRTTAFGARGRAGKFGALRAMLSRARAADVVHCTGWDATLWGRVAALLARRPMLITEHTPGRDLQVSRRGGARTRLIAAHNRILGGATYATIVVARWQRALLEGEGVPARSIVHIPNAIPVQRLREEAAVGLDRKDLSIPRDAEVIAHVARFSPQKGQLHTLAALRALRGHGNDVRVLFVGDGPERATVEAAAADFPPGVVSFLGTRADVPRLLKLSDLAVLPSSAEGLPMAVIEALALGVPVVATDVGDVPWLLDRWPGGIVVPHDDEEGFANACARVLGDAALRSSLGEAGLRGAETFDAARMVDRYEKVFDAAVRGAPLPSFEAELESSAAQPATLGRG